MPNNKALDTIIKKKSLEFSDLSSSEIAEVIKEDEMQAKQMLAAQAMGQGMMGQPGQQQGQPQLGGGNPQPQPQPQLGQPGQPQQMPMQA